MKIVSKADSRSNVTYVQYIAKYNRDPIRQ
eukprot:COSAG01_NODE_15719_length_1306_cov_3.323115_1_plen_29_part_10